MVYYSAKIGKANIVGFCIFRCLNKDQGKGLALLNKKQNIKRKLISLQK